MRRIALVAGFLAALLVGPVALAQVKFSGLPTGSAVSSTDITAFDQGAPCPSSCTTVQVTAAQIRTFVLAFSGWATQSANTVLAGPTSGAAAAPGFRTLVGADLPDPGASSLGGVESFTASAHNFLTGINTSGIPQQAQPAASDLSNGVTGSGAAVLAGSPTFTAGIAFGANASVCTPGPGILEIGSSASCGNTGEMVVEFVAADEMISLAGNAVWFNATTPALSGPGLGSSPSVAGGGGSAAGVITAGSAPSNATFTLTFAPTNATGWACHISDETNEASIVVGQTGHTPTTAVFQAYSRTTGATQALTASDALSYQCMGY